MNAFFDFLKVIAICGTALVALFLVLLAIPKSPIRDFTLSLTKRAGATAIGAGAFLPIDVVPVLGEFGDVAILIFLGWYWYTFFRDMQRPSAQLPPAAPQRSSRVIDIQSGDPTGPRR